MSKCTYTLVILIVIIVALIAYIVISSNLNKDVTTKTTVKYVYDTTTVTNIVEKPVPYKVVYAQNNYDTVEKIIYTKIDTASIVKEFLSKKIYKRVLVKDSNLTAVLYDTVYKNELGIGKFEYKINRPTSIITTTNTTVSSKVRYYAGVGVSSDKSTFAFVSVSGKSVSFTTSVNSNGVVSGSIGFSLTKK